MPRKRMRGWRPCWRILVAFIVRVVMDVVVGRVVTRRQSG